VRVKTVRRPLQPSTYTWCGGRRRQGVRPVELAILRGTLVGQTAIKVGVEPFAQFLNVDAVNVQLELLLQLVQVLSYKTSNPFNAWSRLK